MIRPARLLSLVLYAALAVAAALFAFHTLVPRDPPAEAGPGYKSRCNQFKPSALATKYLEHLHGIEIGASTQNSFGLKRSVNVDFSDEQGGLWQDKACAPAVVNIVALGDDLPFKSGTLDYVLSSHVIEHFFDPIKALREWYRVIKPGGYIFIIAPHKDRTFDNVREVTPLRELIDRAAGRIRISSYARPPDPKAPEPQVLLRDGAKPQPGWTLYDKDDHHHWSVWRTEDFVELVKFLKYDIVEVQDVDDKVGNGFTVVIQKRPVRQPGRRPRRPRRPSRIP